MNKKGNNILITGGAGYIGSHVAELLTRTKSKVIILDNLVTGFRKLNAEEQALQSQITALKSKIQQRGGAKLVQSDETVTSVPNVPDSIDNLKLS